MLKRRLGTLFMMTCLILTTVPAASGGSGAQVVNVAGCSNVKFYDNKIYMFGHDGLYASTCSNVEAYKNDITCRETSFREFRPI